MRVRLVVCVCVLCGTCPGQLVLYLTCPLLLQNTALVNGKVNVWPGLFTRISLCVRMYLHFIAGI